VSLEVREPVAAQPAPASTWHNRCAVGSPRGLLLDFGSVISVSIFERHAETEAILGLTPGTLRWLGPLAPESDELWRAMLANRISERDYWAQRARELGELVGEPGWDMPTLLKRVRQLDPNTVVRPQITALVRAARRQQLKVGILSNELALFYGEKFLAGMQVLSEFDAIVDATHNGILKPDPRAYGLAVAAMGLPAEQILFVDDQFRNIEGGWQAGLQTHYFDLRDVPGNMAAIAARLGLDLGAHA
jgi:putative hydrolase of the HAD superfamily